MIYLYSIANAFPELVVNNTFFPALEGNTSKMFKGTHERRHISRGETSVDLFEKAAKNVELKSTDRLGGEGLNAIDAIFTNVSLPDLPFTGCGAMLAQRLRIKPKLVIDFHSGGCVSFLLILEYAQALAKLYSLKNILVCIGQTAAGRIFSNEKIRQKPQAAIPGDGVSVALITPDTGALIHPIIQHCHPEYAADMGVQFDDGRKYWEPGTEPGYLDFPEEKVASILMRGNRLVPAVMKEVLKAAHLKNSNIDGLITNQPNPFFLRNWRESIELPEEKHFHTFGEYANLFQAGIPVNLAKAIDERKIKDGQNILLAGFSHAGDFSAAALLRWTTPQNRA